MGGTLELFQFYFADLLVHDIKKVKRLHWDFVYLFDITPLVNKWLTMGHFHPPIQPTNV